MTPRPGGPGPARGGLGSAVVIGTGLIGTSVALALCERGVTVWLTDHDPAAARLAADIGAGKVLPEPLGAAEPGPAHRQRRRHRDSGRRPGGPWADLAVLAVPPAAVAPSLAAAQARRLARWYTDVASVKALPLRQASELGCDLTSFVPGHPLSGRERSGPAAARADLFLGRPWVICPGPQTAAGGDRGRRRPGALLPRRAGAARCGRARPLGGPGLARAACGGRGHGGPAGGPPTAHSPWRARDCVT